MNYFTIWKGPLAWNIKSWQILRFMHQHKNQAQFRSYLCSCQFDLTQQLPIWGLMQVIPDAPIHPIWKRLWSSMESPFQSYFSKQHVLSPTSEREATWWLFFLAYLCWHLHGLVEIGDILQSLQEENVVERSHQFQVDFLH